jgi:hypothetical protein
MNAKLGSVFLGKNSFGRFIHAGSSTAGVLPL